MEENKQGSSWLKNFTTKSQGKKLNIKYLFILLAIGVLFMLIGSYLKTNEEPATAPTIEKATDEEPSSDVFKSDERPKEISTMSEYETFYETQLAKALEQVVGVSDVTVVVNLAETEKMVFQTNTNVKEQFTNESDREGGTREVSDSSKDEQVVIIRKGDGEEEALTIKIEKPDIRGVLIVANGVDNIQVKTWVVEAVSRVLDVPSHRVAVLPKKSKEES